MPGRATSFDIAALAGVSQPTVSRALRGDPTVSEQTRKRIEAIAIQLNYAVDKNASGLRSQSAHTLALLLFEDPTPDESQINPFFLSMLGAITRTCATHGYDLLISFQQMAHNWHAQFEDSRKADGLILLGYGDYELYRARLDQLVAQGTHFVRWGSVQPDEIGTTIGCDNFGGGEQAARHLIAQGRTAIAFIGDASSHYPEFRDRYHGACAAMRAAGLPVDAALQVDAITTEESGYDAARLLIGRGLVFDAVFAASDLIAIGALRALEEAGRSVPADVALIGFDGIPAASLTRPPLSTIQQDFAAGGRKLVETLLTLIRNGQVDATPVPTRLVARQSTARS